MKNIKPKHEIGGACTINLKNSFRKNSDDRSVR